MAWQSSNDFEDEIVEMQPNHNFVHGQWAYEEAYKNSFQPRPQAHYDYLEEREKRNAELDNLHGPRSAKSKHIRERLEMMDRLQKIAGTRPLGENATIADWEDRTTVEQEAVALMRHFGMMSMSDGWLEPTRPLQQPPTPDEQPIKVIGRYNFPVIMDPKYFEPRKPDSSESSLSDSSCFYDARHWNNSISTQSSGSCGFVSAKSELDNSREVNLSRFRPKRRDLNSSSTTTTSSSRSSTATDTSYVPIAYMPLEESFDREAEEAVKVKEEESEPEVKSVEEEEEPEPEVKSVEQAEKRRKNKRPNQRQRRAVQSSKLLDYFSHNWKPL